MDKFWWQGAYDSSDFDWLESNESDSVQITGYQIKRVIDVTKNEIKQLRPEIIQIEYSTFVKQPEETVKKILDHLDLSHDQACFDYFKKNKIYNQNKKNATFFSDDVRTKLEGLFD